LNSDGTTKEIFRTEILYKTLNPQFKSFTLRSKDVCNGDLSKKIRITCIDWDRFTEHDLIGVCDISILDLVNYGKSKRFPFINDSMKKKKNVNLMLFLNLKSIKIQEN
jgi:Ca2+-dependent lipid-binding protein